MCGLPYPVETDWGKPRGTGVGSMGGSKASKDSLFKVKRCPETYCICSSTRKMARIETEKRTATP